jgi:hypothetical protein
MRFANRRLGPGGGKNKKDDADESGDEVVFSHQMMAMPSTTNTWRFGIGRWFS